MSRRSRKSGDRRLRDSNLTERKSRPLLCFSVMIVASQIISLIEEVIYRPSPSFWSSESMPVSDDASTWSQSMRDLQDFTRTRDFQQEPRLRFTLYLPKNEVLAWCAFQATHTDMHRHYYSGQSVKDTICGIIDVRKRVFCADTYSRLWGKSKFDPYSSDAEDREEGTEWIDGIERLRTYLSGLSYKRMAY